MDLPIRPAAPSSIPLRAAPTLTTLPTEIKNEIFSHLLLGEKVKYFKSGTVPGYAYAFQMNIARTNKQFCREANDYLRMHNNFALVHVHYPRLMPFLSPHVAVGKRARSFEHPAIEATLQDLDPKAIRPDYDLEFCFGPKDAPTRRILFLVQDLPHFCRQLQLEIHVWPSSQIYVHPYRSSTPIQYSPIIVKNNRKVVWKVNASHRSDLTVQERRARQEDLISSISTVIGHDIAIRFFGVEEDITARTIAHMTPRIVSVDAAGWNLLENMQSQKRYLDASLVRGPHGSKELRCAYVKVAQVVFSSQSWLSTIVQHNTAFLFHTPYRKTPGPSPVATIPFADYKELHAMASPWIDYVYIIALECLLNALSLALDDNDIKFLVDVRGNAWVMHANFFLHRPLPAELGSVATQYTDWNTLWGQFLNGTAGLNEVREAMQSINLIHSSLQLDYVYHKEDSMYLQDMLTKGVVENPCGWAPGLRRRKRTFTDPHIFERPSDMHGWTSEAIDNLSPELQRSIINHSDAAIKSKKIVTAEKTRAEGHVMLHLYDGTPPAGYP